MWLLWSVALLAGAAALPPRARALLDQKYQGWRMAYSAPQIESWFQQYMPAFHPNLVFGDFNKDGKTDYAAQVLAGGRQHVVAFVASGTGYSMMPLAEDPADPFTFLVIYKRGEKDFGIEASMLKMRASDLAMRISTEAVQLHGGYGYCKEFRAERLMRDAKITQIWEGTNQVHRQLIGRSFINRKQAGGR